MADDAAAPSPVADYLRLLVDLGQAFSEAVPDYDALLRTVAGRLAAATGAACTIRLLAGDGRWLTPAAAEHPDPALRDTFQAYLRVTPERADGGFWGPLIAERRTLRLALDAGTPPPGASAAQAAFLRAHHVSALLGAPLVARGRVLGGLTLLRFGRAAAFTAAEEDFLRALADRAALALDNADLYRQARASEARFRGLAEFSPDGVLIIQGGRYVYANSAAARLLGAADPAALVGLAQDAVVAPADRARARERQARALAGEIVEPITFELVRLDGGRVAVDASSGPATWDGAPAVQGLWRDATARLVAEAALRASEAQYRALIEHAADAIVLADLDGTILEANAATLALLGYPREALLGRRAHAFVPAEDLVAEPLHVAEALAGGVVRSERRMRHRDGSLRHIAVSARRIGPDRIQGIWRDVTAQRAAEAALRESEARYRTMVQAAPIGIATHDAMGRQTGANPAWLEMLGYPPEALPDLTLQRITHPDDVPRHVALFAELASGARDRIALEKRYRRADGGLVWGRLTAAAVRDARGALRQTVSMVEDITERKAAEAALRQAGEALGVSERRYRALFEQASDPIFIITADGALLDANERACDLLGYQHEEFLALTVPELVVTDPNQFDATRAAFRAGSTVRFRRQLKRRDGALVPVEIVARRLEDGRIQVIARDISERERAEAALRESEARFRALFDADVMPICFWHAGGQVTEANDAYLALTGFSRAALAAGALRWDERTAPEHRDRDAQALAEAAEHGAWAPHEKDYLRHDGCRVPVLCGGAILPGHDDRGVAFVIDLSERKRAEALLRELSARLFHVQDEERRRIARELHDVTAQDLFAQSLLLARLAAEAAGPDWRGHELLAEARALGDKTLRELRTQSYLLHPPLLDELGLAAALEWFVDGFAQRSGIAVELAADAAVGRLPAAVELALYRVAQEGLGNIHRHAGSATARVALGRDRDTATLRVEDRGRGLAGTPEGVGIAGMRERLVPLGGHLAIASSERGTVVTATVPIPPDAAP